LNEPVDFLAQVDFLTPMVFRISVAAELGRPALAETALEQHRHPEITSLTAGLGISSMLKLHWLKSTFARKSPGSFTLESNNGSELFLTE